VKNRDKWRFRTKVADPNSWEKGEEDTEVFVIIVTIWIFITPISCKEK